MAPNTYAALQQSAGEEKKEQERKVDTVELDGQVRRWRRPWSACHASHSCDADSAMPAFVDRLCSRL